MTERSSHAHFTSHKPVPWEGTRMMRSITSWKTNLKGRCHRQESRRDSQRGKAGLDKAAQKADRAKTKRGEEEKLEREQGRSGERQTDYRM